MCTVVILRRKNHDWPLIIGANRDEQFSRPWKEPGYHWPELSDVIGGLDEEGGGSWLALNKSGVIASVLNQSNTPNQEEDKRSRGELVLEALNHADARDAAESLQYLNPEAYRPFHLVVADNHDAYVIYTDARVGTISIREIPIGYSMITRYGLNAEICLRTKNYLPQFKTSPVPDPVKKDFKHWEKLLKSSVYDVKDGSDSAMLINANGFGTVTSSLLAIPKPGLDHPPVFLATPDRPDNSQFIAVNV